MQMKQGNARYQVLSVESVCTFNVFWYVSGSTAITIPNTPGSACCSSETLFFFFFFNKLSTSHQNGLNAFQEVEQLSMSHNRSFLSFG